MENKLARDISSTSYQASYDRCCKMLLSHKIILAHIMKECVEEFKDFDVKYISENCIESNPEISTFNVHQGENQKERINGLNTEDISVDEGTVRYDIRFVAVVPQSGEMIKLIINLEAQKDYYPGYPLIKRGIYYASRMISSQYEVEFKENDYSGIKKVYSIWVCTSVPKKYQNTITRYRFTEDNLVGEVKEHVKNYDLINVIMVYLEDDNENLPSGYNKMLKLLRVLLSDLMSPIKKKEVLNSDFDIKTDVKLEKELVDMCNLSSSVLERGIEQGIEQGKIEDLKNIMKNLKLTFEEAANAMNIPEEKRAEYMEKI